LGTDKAVIKKTSTARKVNIATGSNRFTKKWKNTEISYQSLIERLQTTTRTRETFAEYKRMAKTQRDQVKDVGGFVGGALKDGRRKAENIANRTLLTLDLDNVDISTNDLWDSITMLNDYEILLYSTHSHEPKAPRLRLIIPLDRPVFPDEYQAIGRKIAEEIGIDMFDDTTYEPSRLMYWPSTSADGEFVFKRQEGPWLDPDEVLNKYLDWRDVSFWPTSSRHAVKIHSQIKKQEDPLAKKGIIGAFCRTYSIAEAIEKFLSDIYIPTQIEGRYTYAEGSTVGGLVTYEDKFAYSHHGTDPVSGMLCNAFDLVRIHKFGIRDEDAKPDTPVNRLPSFTAMSEFASSDEQVKVTMGTESLNEAMEDFEDLDEGIDTEWLKLLDYDNKGRLRSTIDNAVIILENDPRIKDKLVYNDFANRATVTGKLPWSEKYHSRDWCDDDDAGVRHFLEHHYNLTGASKIADAVSIVYQKNKVHPVREYLNSLTWDGVKRIETLLTDYLGAEDSIYTRAVIRTHLAAAVARVMRPGCKYDTMITLIGPQGCGKSTFVKNLGVDWFSDSLDTVKGKEAYEQLQGAWIIEMGELTATRKADIEATKLFLSKSEDIYRVAYGRRTSRFPRQCVFWGTTNDKEFLRDKTGDRRTWPVDCMVVQPIRSVWEEMPKEVDQIWAEAVQLYNSGHDLILKGKAAEEAIRQQREHAEDSPKAGLIEEYLNRDYPANWDDMDLFERRNYLDGVDDFDAAASTAMVKKNKTCVMEIWCELFKGDPKSLTPILSREINDILRSLDGWEKAKSVLSFGKIYGKQRAFIRKQN
jgi:putative DNA primase/helicase